ncbi:11234_t:CDS:2 [Gigaspora margarita]|uniref:11234_t:CDS:1 n=1 Tax=Gigaspora margarita TaxID=4874 RepID=A0ABN7UGA1_GIGMA|nr:11234_t:CDS:2 [Gigaspora margarita]
MYNKDNSNIGSVKPVIYYNKRFHYVEEDTAVNFHFDTDYALFQIYNLKGNKNEFVAAITSLAGPASAVAFLNDFERTYPRHSDHRIELRVNSPIEQSTSDRLKAFRNSSIIEKLTENGFADWVPLDSSSYECIMQMMQIMQKTSIQEPKISKTEDWNYSILRTLSDPIDSVLLDVALDNLMGDLEIGTFEKLFPGPVTDVDLGVNGVFMTVLQTKERYSFDEDVGKIFIEILNSLIHDRKVEKFFDKTLTDLEKALTEIGFDKFEGIYSRAIHSHRKAIPVHAAVGESIESLQRWLNRISVVKKCKVPMNNNELASRKATLTYLFDELVSAAADMRLSIGLEDEFKRHR